jgi:hypothetical protein
VRVVLERVVDASLAILAVAFLWGLETHALPSELKPSSVNYGKDHRIELRLYGTKIGDVRRAPFSSGRRDALGVRIARVAPTVRDPEDIIEIRRLGFLVPLVPYRNELILTVLVIGAALISPIRETLARIVTPVLLTVYGLFLLAVGLSGALFGPRPALRHIENASVGGVVLLPFYFACWLTFVIAILAGILILTRWRWAATVAVCAQAALIVSVLGLLLPAVEARAGYRVEALGWALYGGTSFSLLALAIWFLRRPRVRASFAKSRA